MSHWDVIVLGAGASGLMCSATAAYQGKSVLVIDHAPKAAAKIRISGGGKCNFTNLDVSPHNFICQNAHFVKSALSRYPSSAFIELVERHGLAYETRELGKLFCAERAADLIQILRTECDWAGVNIELGSEVESVKFKQDQYQVKTSQGLFSTSKLVVATGALSFPKLKATGIGYDIAQQFGLQVIKTSPGLVPLSFDGKWQARFSELSGLSMDIIATANGHSFKEAMLFTHKGLSGPGILQVSNYWKMGQVLEINLLPEFSIETVFEALKSLKLNGKSLPKWLNQFWPKRFTQIWLEAFPIETVLSNVTDEALQNYAQQLTHWQLYPAGTGGYGKAEVTLGGVDTDEVSSKTFEAKNQPGLYFIGEVLDVTGHLGGFNFQWAWASGVACGLSV
ncbi:MAG: NAD(P)/FAD-dependent oxidoreductase [Thiomicrorhabdus sp.]|jgi:predicted Rossmann fold flavoprotein|nr:NAD(P)/FAD-dependent oxidoreductase [Thiomicrorhabdus sp.]